MSKTIRIQSIDDVYEIDLDALSSFAKGSQPLHKSPSSWYYAKLVGLDAEGEYCWTPRGKDLLASYDSIPDDPVPESTDKPCTSCNGVGEKPLFVYMETCDRCKGSKVEPQATNPDLSQVEITINGVKLPSLGFPPLYEPSQIFVHDSIRCFPASDTERGTWLNKLADSIMSRATQMLGLHPDESYSSGEPGIKVVSTPATGGFIDGAPYYNPHLNRLVLHPTSMKSSKPIE